MLIKLSAGDIGFDKPTDFAIYSNSGRLLLQRGYVIDSAGLLDRLYRLGYRDDTPAGTKAVARFPSGERAATNDEFPLFFSAYGADHIRRERQVRALTKKDFFYRAFGRRWNSFI